MFSSIADPEIRLARLHDVRRRRLAQPIGFSYRMANTCALIPDILEDNHGYHRICNQRFFSNLNRLKHEFSQTDAAPTSRPTRVLGDHVLFKPNCIFCNSEKRKKVKIKGSWTTEGMSMFEMGGWKTVLQVVEHRNDERLLRRIRGHDLFACEAKFHQSCRIKYVQDPTKWQSSNNKAKSKQPLTEHIHYPYYDFQKSM